MPSVQVKNVPDATHAVLRQRAARAHQTLQEYLLELIVSHAENPTVDEVFERIDLHPRGGSLSPEVIVEAIRHERDSH